VGWAFNALHRSEGRYPNFNGIAWVNGAKFFE
jgi:hypothetical protein